MPNVCQTAFKEWAVTIDALARGEQILLLRKGGIHEPDRHFRVEHDRFLFYPGYLHQDAALLKPEYRSRLTAEPNASRAPDASRAIEKQPDPEFVTFSLYAEVADVIQLDFQDSSDSPDSERAAAALEPFHIWAPGFALKRVHWKPRHPLNVILLRCYSLAEPVSLPVTPEYSGCTSWVDLGRDVPLGKLTPALSDDEFERRVSDIRNALASTPAAV